jgi:tRNA threonylcarbamoyladenosine biosynthesis protein TsaE
MSRREVFLPDEAATLALGRELSEGWRDGGLVFLHGDLGAGKTTLVRGLLSGLGWSGAVRSPSYALVNSYATRPQVRHLDLYRVSSLDEALSLDLDALFADSLSLVEWPDVLVGAFRPDVTVRLTPSGEGRLAALETHTVE